METILLLTIMLTLTVLGILSAVIYRLDKEIIEIDDLIIRGQKVIISRLEKEIKELKKNK